MKPQNTQLFERLVTLHQPDCDLLTTADQPDPVPTPDDLAMALKQDITVRYAVDCQPIYEDLRRVIGQLAGLLVLARLTKSGSLADLPERAKCEDRWAQATDRLAHLAAPGDLSRHKTQLEAAHRFSGQVLRKLSQLKTKADTATLDAAGDLIQRA